MTRVVAAVLGLAFAGTVFSLSPVKAADLALPAAPYIEPVQEFGGWYLRGHIGMSNQRVRKLDNALFDETVTVHKKDFDEAVFFGGGVGYAVNRWVRFDVTGEYRGKSKFTGLDSYPGGFGFGGGTNDYTTNKREWLFLANAYVDVGNWHGFKPYVGAGLGFAQIKLGHLLDVNVPQNGGGWAEKHSEWNLAWALYAGIGYQLTENWTLDLGYRYLHLGDTRTGDIIAFDGTNNSYNPLEFKDISSHDFMVGLRYSFGGAPSMPSFGSDEPLFAKF